MSRPSVRYGDKLLLYCESRHGYVVGTNSALAPVGVRPDVPEEPLSFERCVFVIAPGDGEFGGSAAASVASEEVKFGQVVRLIHNMHQKPMALNANLHAMVNKANQRVTLEKSTNTDLSDKWRIMPRFRLRGEGERVCNFDHVVLQAASGEVAYLHVSSTRDGGTDNSYEVNCGPVSEGFELQVYDSDRVAEGGGRELRGGQCIVLHHKEENRRFAVDPKTGSCLLDPVQDSGDDENGRRQAESHSYKSMFIIEFSDPRHGGIVQGGRRNMYRLKAVCNDYYLCVREQRVPAAAAEEGGVTERALSEHEVRLRSSEEGEVADLDDGSLRYELALTSDVEALGTLFVFHQAGDEQGNVMYSGSRVYVEAPMIGDGVWLAAGDVVEPRHLRELLVAPTTEQKSLRLECRVEKSMRDGVELQRLPSDEYEELSVVLSLLPPLQSFVESVARCELDAGRVAQVLENTRQLRRLCFQSQSANQVAAGNEVDGLLSPVGQVRLLRQGVPQLCLDIIRSTLECPLINQSMLNTMEVVRVDNARVEAATPSRQSGRQSVSSTLLSEGFVPVKYADVLDLLNSCFALVDAVVRGQPKLARELSPYLEFVVGCCRVLPSALGCIAEFYRDNVELVNTPGDTKSLHFFLEMLLERGRDTAVLEVVTLFAMCGDLGLEESQQLIVQRVMRTKEVAKVLLLPITSSSGALQVGVPATYGSLRNERSLPTDQPDALTMVPITRLQDVSSSAYVQQGRNAVVPYLTQQVLLMSAVCAGRNSTSTLAVQQLIPPELMLPLLQCEEMVPDLHAAFVQLFTQSLVDVAGSPDLFERTRSIRHVIDEPQMTESYSLEEDVPGILASAKRYCLGYLQRCGQTSLHDEARVKELDAVVTLQLALAKRGMFALEEYVELVRALTSVLDCVEAGPPSAVDAGAVSTMRHVIAVLNRLADFLLTRDVYDVVNSFVRGMSLRHVSQFQDLSPSSKISEYSKRRMEALQASHVDEQLNTLFSLGQVTKGYKEFEALVRLLNVLMAVARTEHWELRSAAIALFCRLTNYPGELLLTVRRVQLLTSAASAEFYNRVKRVASELEVFSKVPLVASGLGRGEAALSHIESLLTQRDCGAMIEKIAMLRHAEVPQMLLDLMSHIAVPPKDELRLFVFNIVGVLQTMAQDPLVLEQLSASVSKFVHLTTYDMDVLSLLRTIYCGKPLMAMQLTQQVIKEVVACIALEHSAATAIQLARDILATKDAGGKYISKNQRAVWKALVADADSARLLRLRGQWTGKKGTALRDRCLLSEDYYNHSGRLRQHVATLEVLFLTAKTNELVKPEEIRDELFGPNGVDDLVEVVTNPRLPAFYRFRFVNVLQVTVVQDASCVSSLLTHRQFPEFLRLCRVDVNKCLQLLGGACANTADDELVARVERGVLRRKPTNDYELAIEQRRSNCDFYCELVTMGVMPCVRHLMMRFTSGTARLSAQIRQHLVEAINELVDCICDMLRQVFVLRDVGEVPYYSRRMPRKKSQDFLRTAMKFDFTGLGRWADDIATLADGIPVEDPDRLEMVASGTGVADEKALTSKWLEFVKKNLQEAKTNVTEAVYASGAGVIMRSGRTGTNFVKTLILSLRDLGATEQTRVLHLLRQVVRLHDREEFDDSPLLEFESFESDVSILTLSKSEEDRQELLSSYFAERPHNQVVPAVTQIMSNGRDEVRAAALQCALVLLGNGHRGMQQSLFASVSSRGDEDLFIVLRGHLQSCRDSLRSYRYALRRGAKEEAQVVLGSLDTITMQLEYIRLLCEGHFEKMQHYLRSQPDNHVSVNVLESLVEILEVGVEVPGHETFEVLCGVLSTIVEAIQGPCRANQDLFVSLNISESLTALLVLRSPHPMLRESEVIELRRAALSVLLSLIEGRCEPSFIGRLLTRLDLSLLGAAMTQSVKEYEARWGPLEEKTTVWAKSFGFLKRIYSYIEKIYKTDNRDETNDELGVAVNIFIFFKTCLDLQQLMSYGGSNHEFVDRKGNTIREVLRQAKCYKSVNKRVGMIEILREGTLERSYFRILSTSADNLRDHSKEALIKTVDRSSDNKRLQDFFDQCNKLMLELDYYAQMRNSPLLSFIHDYAAEFDILGLLIVFAINIIMVSTYRVADNIYDDATPGKVQQAMTVLGIILIVFQCMLFVNFFFGPTRVYLEGRWSRWQDEKVDEMLDEHRAGLAIEPLADDIDFLGGVTPWQYTVQSAYYILQYGQFWELSLYLICSVLGYAQSPIWYTVQLLQITSKSTLLYNVVLAVTTNGASLLLTLVLMLFVVYIFASISFYQFSELFSPVVSGWNGFECDTLLQCWLLHIDGFRSGGGVGDNSAPPSFGTHGQGYLYYLFRMMYFIAINTIFLNIVFGIIVDSFASLREQREFVDEDQVNKCFICGIEQNEFDRVVPGGFEQHIRTEHNMWHYLFYMHFVKKKDKSNLSGQESHVWLKMKEKEASFFPIGRALMLQSDQLDAQAEERRKLEQYRQVMEAAVGKFAESLDNRMEAFSDRLERLDGGSDKLAASTASRGGQDGTLPPRHPQTKTRVAGAAEQQRNAAAEWPLPLAPSRADSFAQRPFSDASGEPAPLRSRGQSFSRFRKPQ